MSRELNFDRWVFFGKQSGKKAVWELTYSVQEMGVNRPYDVGVFVEEHTTTSMRVGEDAPNLVVCCCTKDSRDPVPYMTDACSFPRYHLPIL